MTQVPIFFSMFHNLHDKIQFLQKCNSPIFHPIRAGAPCLSFDVLTDTDGDGRKEFPLSMLLCAGTQADTAMANRLVFSHAHNTNKPKLT